MFAGLESAAAEGNSFCKSSSWRACDAKCTSLNNFPLVSPHRTPCWTSIQPFPSICSTHFSRLAGVHVVDADCLLLLLLFVLSAPCLDLFLRSLTSLLSLLFSSSPHLSSPPEVDPRPRSSVFSSSSPPLFPPLRLLTLLFPFIHPSFCLFYPLIPPVILPFSLSLPFHIHHPSSALLFIPLLSALFILSSTHLLFIALTSRSSFSFPPNLSRLDLGSAGLLICLPLISSSFSLSVFYSFCFKTLGFTSSSLTHIFFIQLLSQNVNHCKLNPELIEYVQEWNFSFANNRTRTSCQTSRWQTQNHWLYPLMETMRSWRSAVCFTAATNSN